jgi:hypothetical protein
MATMLRKHQKSYCVRVTVYTPDPFRGQTHSSISLTGVIPESLECVGGVVLVVGHRRHPGAQPASIVPLMGNTK